MAQMITGTTILDGLLLGVFCILVVMSFRRHQPTFPPGPPGLPLVSNAFGMPKSHEWLTYARWGEKYGSVVYIHLFGSPLVIFNSAKAAMDLLEKRSAISSDRPTMFIASRVVGWERSLPLMSYGQTFRDMRRLFSMLLGSKAAIASFVPLIEKETRRCMANLLTVIDRDVSIEPLVRKSAGTIIMAVAYGYEVHDDNDPFVRVAGETLDDFSFIVKPAATMVDTFPLLKYVPDWAPGGGWKKSAKAWISHFKDMSDGPFEWVKQQMASGNYEPSFSSMHLLDCETPEKEELIKMSAQAIWAGGTDTTLSSNMSFIALVYMHPDMQAKAHAELDAVIGSGRLPALSDRDELPYVNALFLESLRYYPIAPMGAAPHYMMEDEIYEGYFIPKGTSIVANIWAMYREPGTYPNPGVFNPDRFLDSLTHKPERDPRDYIFGFGRRICPGQLFGDYSSFIFCMTILALYEILPAQDEPPPQIDNYWYMSGLISHPPPFKCRFRLRSPNAETLLRSLSEDI